MLNAIVADPEGFDLTNVTNACVTPNIAPFTCAPADAYLFWDGTILAQETSNALP